jgi:hypothetical protein
MIPWQEGFDSFEEGRLQNHKKAHLLRCVNIGEVMPEQYVHLHYMSKEKWKKYKNIKW